MEIKGNAAAGNATATSNADNAKKNFGPLIVDAVIPTAGYYLLKHEGMSTVSALAWSSVVPAARTIWGLIKERQLNGLAALMLVVNVVGLALTFLTGDPRLMLAKDSAVSSTVGIGILVSVALGRPMMTAGLKPWLVKADSAKSEAWDRLSAESTAFRRIESRFSLIWGTALLGECVVRVVGAYTLPVDTMVWLGGVFTGGAILIAMVIGSVVAVNPMEKLIAAETAEAAPETTFTPATV
ncbi:VC0807 family protein [Streptomyces sp. NBC_01465]|uniref:VC0807 family protein n=1 Tax=Streptomyces sp. NBC_01465 TaxID=2903878 RepID=UPI002E360B96|nr:VC0807 family protein [Streptomyces sp. NBC_01465]